MSDLLEVGTEVGHEKPRKSGELSNLSNLAYLRPGGGVSSHLCVATTDLANRAERSDRSDRSDIVLIYIALSCPTYDRHSAEVGRVPHISRTRVPIRATVRSPPTNPISARAVARRMAGSSCQPARARASATL